MREYWSPFSSPVLSPNMGEADNSHTSSCNEVAFIGLSAKVASIENVYTMDKSKAVISRV